MAPGFFIRSTTVWCLIYVLLVEDIETAANVITKEEPPITYDNINYSWYRRIGANWSSTARASDCAKTYSVLDCTKYGLRIDDFIEKYPYVTIQTDGKANSAETIGDVGSGHFGTVRFDSRNFNNKNYHNEYLVDVHQNAFWWNVGVSIGIGFRNEDNKLYIRPCTNGWVYSGGAVWRYLEFGLSVYSITFHPKDELGYEIIQVILLP